MKKLLSITILVFTFILVVPTLSFAHGMIDDNTVPEDENGHTANEEAKGKEIREKLQAEELECENLTDENFGALGEHFMGQMMGESHKSMNNMMIQMMGEEGEEEMHVALGKRMSGCEPNAAMPQNMMNSGMMQMMMGSGIMGNLSNSSALNNPISMMRFAPFGWIFMILFWVLIIVGIVALIKWIAGQNKTECGHKSASNINKENSTKRN